VPETFFRRRLPQKTNDPIGRRGSFRSARERLNALLDGDHRLILANDLLFQFLLHWEEFLHLFCSMRFSGTPVHFDTMCMISSPVTMTSRSSRCFRHPFKIRSSLSLVCCRNLATPQPFIILRFDRRFFLGADRLDIFLDLFHIRRPSHRVDACRAPASSMTSMALSGRKRPVIYRSESRTAASSASS